MDLLHAGLRAWAGDPGPRAGQGRGCVRALLELAQDGLDFLAKASQHAPALASLTSTISQMKPVARKDRITIEAGLAQTVELLSLPIRQAREPAQRSQCANNLKLISEAMSGYYRSHGTFPPAYSKDPDGKPLLSWRVLILPYLGQQCFTTSSASTSPGMASTTRP